MSDQDITIDNIPLRSDDLWNEDLAPTTEATRTWDWKTYAALWVAMVVCVPTYMLAAGLVAEGLNWWQVVITVFLGNLIVLLPMVLIGYAGAKHGIPFPVLLRSAFGTHGAKIPAVARSLVACGWFGINTWVGGSAIYVILNALTENAFQGSPLPLRMRWWCVCQPICWPQASWLRGLTGGKWSSLFF